MIATKRLSTRQLLTKIPNYPGLYRHKINRSYYGIKKYKGKRKEHSSWEELLANNGVRIEGHALQRTECGHGISTPAYRQTGWNHRSQIQKSALPSLGLSRPWLGASGTGSTALDRLTCQM